MVLEEMGAFIPLTEATVSHAGTGGEKFKAAVAMVNKAAISVLHVGDALSSPGAAPARAHSAGRPE
jgi:hypothetical protein